MKRLLYTTALAFIAILSTSCGDSIETIKEYSTDYADLQGHHKWAIKYTSDPATLALMPTDCDTLFKVAVTATLELAEEVSLPEKMVAEYKDINLYIYGARELDYMTPDQEGLQAVSKLLSGKVKNSADITFYSKASHSRAFIDELLKDTDNFLIGELDFTKNGKIASKELFNALFNGKDIATVITEYEGVVNEFQGAYYTCEESETSTNLDALADAYRIAKSYSLKIDESIDEDDLTNSQAKRLLDSYSRFEDIEYEMW